MTVPQVHSIRSLIAVFLLTSAASGFSQLDNTLVNVHGLTSAGGTFALRIDGEPVYPITITPPSFTNATDGGQLALSDDTTVELTLLAAVPPLSATITSFFTFTATPMQLNVTFGNFGSVYFFLQDPEDEIDWDFTSAANCNIVFTDPEQSGCIVTPTGGAGNSQFVLTAFSDEPLHGLGMTLTTDPGIELSTASYSLSMPPVPEPGTCALAALGLGALWLARRRRH